MVYLLHAHFGRDGREEAEELLQRHSGDPNNPRILGTFNEPIEDWMSFYCFTYFTDRDGKYQLKMLAESGFDPLSRTCRFMLTEEAHHMFVGETGVGRVIKRACEVMNELKTDDAEKVRAAGAIDLATVQKYLNFWFSSSLDLFGSDVSTNAAAYFATGLKGRPDEDQYEDHIVADATYTVEELDDAGHVVEAEVSYRNAMNAVARQAYAKDCDIGVQRWNRLIKKAGVDFEMKLPSVRFRRNVGNWANFHFDPAGNPISDDEWAARKDAWIPSDADRAHVKSLMVQVTEPGKMAGWIAPPDRGINRTPIDYGYVRL
jgi:benzoyl-CoA 2,3-dioxygenase component B